MTEAESVRLISTDNAIDVKTDAASAEMIQQRDAVVIVTLSRHHHAAVGTERLRQAQTIKWAGEEKAIAA